MQESKYYFEVYYQGHLVQTIVAHTKWEAIDRVFYRHVGENPLLNRSFFKAKKIR
jgi:hypothetical protein